MLQNVTSSWGGTRKFPYAFTEQGTQYRPLRSFSLKYEFRLVNRTFSKKMKICPLKHLFMVYFNALQILKGIRYTSKVKWGLKHKTK